MFFQYGVGAGSISDCLRGKTLHVSSLAKLVEVQSCEKELVCLALYQPLWVLLVLSGVSIW